MNSQNKPFDAMASYTFEVTPEFNGLRIDTYAASLEIALSRTAAVELISKGNITINNKRISKKTVVKTGDSVEIYIPPIKAIDLTPENIPIDVIFQDADIAVINKPQGMVVHPAHGNLDGTLVNAIMFHIKDLSGINGEIRPGIVHRLDKDTSGIIIIAKNDTAHRTLAEQFKARTCDKKYLALVEGVFSKQHDIIETYISRDTVNRKKMAISKSGKIAITEYKVLEQFEDAALVECILHTGRTHQIRLHLASIGHPCLGDIVYGFKKNRYNLKGQALHSASLTISHPSTGERLTFNAPVPEYMQKLLEKLRK